MPHLNEPADLWRCLRALDTQRTDGVPFEIIVVDNGSREPPTAVCASLSGVRLIVERTPGPGPARTRGAREARGDIVAFIDADCFAEPGWIRGIAGYFAAHREVDIIAGSVGIACRTPERPTDLEAYEARYSYRVRLYVERDHYAATGNMAVRKSAFEAVGPFGGIGTMEDRAWGQRATDMGFRLAYVPGIRVLTPACKSFEELAQRWDRHIAHDFGEAGVGVGAAVVWLSRGMAVALSPALEVVRLALPDGGHRPMDRLRAFAVLSRIRLHRARTMFSLLVHDQSAQVVNSWNRH